MVLSGFEFFRAIVGLYEEFQDDKSETAIFGLLLGVGLIALPALQIIWRVRTPGGFLACLCACSDSHSRCAGPWGRVAEELAKSGVASAA